MRKIKTKSTADYSVLSVLDSDLIFCMKASINGPIVTNGIKVFVKDTNGWQQMGLIHSVRMRLKADVPQPGIEVEFTEQPKLPAPLKKAIAANVKKLGKLGVTVKKIKK